MKKAYVKPGMYVENFSLSQSIAAGCGAIHDSTLGTPAQGDVKSCGWDMGNTIVWNVGVNNCDFPGGEYFEGVCYNNPNGGTNIFAS